MKKRNRNTPKRVKRARRKSGRAFKGRTQLSPIEICRDLVAFCNLVDELDIDETKTQF